MTTQERNVLIKDCMIDYIEPYSYGWWHGWDEIESHVNHQLVKLKGLEGVDVKYLKKLMQSLKVDGIVESRPIWSDGTTLNGKGWFLV